MTDSFISKLDNHIIFNPDLKEFKILNESLGTYLYNDIVKSQIVYEQASYKGKSPLFSHKVLISTMNSSLFIEMKKIYVGVEIKMLSGQAIYVYISDQPVIQHNQQFKDDVKLAQSLKNTLDDIAQNLQQNAAFS